VTKGLTRSDYTWTQYANVLWIEQPAGVGFSYSETAADYNTNDTRAASDNYVFIQNWLKKFPQFQGRDFWLTGESYAGMYIPTFAYNIVSGPDKALFDQFKGWMLGNPVLFCNPYGLDASGSLNLQFNRFFYNGLVSYTNYDKWNKLGCPQKVSAACQSFFNDVETAIGVIDQQLASAEDSASGNQPDLDPDNLYQDFCIGNGTLDQAHVLNEACSPIGDLTSNYFNRRDVQQALHAKVGTVWQVCTGNINYDSNLANEGLIPFLKKIFKLKPSLHILYYSGDVDIATVPLQITQACMSQLSDVVTPTKSWRPWRVNGWHAGYVENFDRYTFATVKGAGHEVPTYQPFFALNMFQRFLTKQSLDDVQVAPVKAQPRHRRQGDVLRELLSKQ
jgi:serine carboxypeptidase-like clade 2